MISAALELRLDIANTRPSAEGSAHPGQLTIKVIMPYVHIVDPLIREARRDRYIVFLHIQDQGQETFDV